MSRWAKLAYVLPAMAVAAALLAGLVNGRAIAAKARPQPSATDQGRQVFQRWCVHCHGEGPRHPGTASLAVKYGNTLPAALEKRQDITPEVVALFVRQGVATMPPFRKTEISDAEMAALGAYLSHQPGSSRKRR